MKIRLDAASGVKMKHIQVHTVQAKMIQHTFWLIWDQLPQQEQDNFFYIRDQGDPRKVT